MEYKKSYSFDELTEIGRKKFALSDDWFCFMGSVEGERLKYGLSPKNEKGEWGDEEVYGYVPLT